MDMPSFERDKMFYVCVRHYLRRKMPLDEAINMIRNREYHEKNLNRLYCAVLRDKEIIRRIESGELPSPVMANIIAIIDGEIPKAR